MESYLGKDPPAEAVQGTAETGFRVWRIWQDRELKRQWIWIEACSTPGAPAQLTWVPLALGEPSAKTKAAMPLADDPPARSGDPLVSSGDAVVVLESGGAFSMRLAGTALEAGRRGQKIRVRLTALPNSAVVVGTVLDKDEVTL